MVHVAIDSALPALSETESITVRGVAGHPSSHADVAAIALTLPDDRPLFVVVDRAALRTAATSDDDVLRLVEALRIGPRPAARWVGTR